MPDWKILDIINKELIYSYAFILNGKKGTYEHIEEEMLKENPVVKRDRAFYIIWFVFYYVLGARTYEEAIKLATPELLKEYKLTTFLTNINGKCDAFLGLKLMIRAEDIDILLECMYERYNLGDCIRCYIRRMEKKGKLRSAAYGRKELKMLEEYDRMRNI